MATKGRIAKASALGSLFASTILTLVIFVLASAGPRGAGSELIMPSPIGFAIIAFVGGIMVGTPASILCLGAAVLITGGRLPADKSPGAGILVGGAGGAIVLLLATLPFEWPIPAAALVGVLYGGCVGFCWTRGERELEING